MKWTNKGNFPDAVVKAITNDSYSKGNADFSVTELISPPQIKVLQKLHATELVKDVSENIWMLFGTSMHNMLQEAEGQPIQRLLLFKQSQLDDIKSEMDALEKGSVSYPVSDKIKEILDREPPISSDIETEYRAFINLGGYTISGAVDWYDKVSLSIEDYKVVTVWKFMNNDWEDYIRQLNMYKYMFADNGRPSKSLRISAIFKDWKAREVGRENYPEYPVMQIEAPMWDSLDTLQYMLDRIRLHAGANTCKSADELSERYPCTDEDRWATKTFAIVKKGGDRASWKFETREEATTKFATLKNAIEYKIEDRSTFKRCEEYCDVSRFCKQYRKGLPKVHLEGNARGVIEGTKPHLIVADDVMSDADKQEWVEPSPKLRGVSKSLEESRDDKVIVSDPQEEHIATIITIPRLNSSVIPETISLGDRLKTKNAARKLERPTVITEKESTAAMIARIKSKTDKAVAKVNEEHGHIKKEEPPVDVLKIEDSPIDILGLFKGEDATIKSDKKKEPNTNIDPSANLGDILGEIGL